MDFDKNVWFGIAIISILFLGFDVTSQVSENLLNWTFIKILTKKFHFFHERIYVFTLNYVNYHLIVVRLLRTILFFNFINFTENSDKFSLHVVTNKFFFRGSLCLLKISVCPKISDNDFEYTVDFISIHTWLSLWSLYIC